MSGPDNGFVARMAERARRAVEARIHSRRVGAAGRWRRAALLWPMFGGER